MAYSNTDADLDKYGFDCKFVTEPPSNLFCPICVLLLRDPYQSQCCGCHYCHCCVQQLVQKSAPCVLCSGVVRAFRDVSVTQQINSLRVKCSNTDGGCEWTGELGYLGEHLVTCEQKPDKCPSCGLFVPKDIFRDHQSLHCPKRPYTCTYCSNFTSTYEEVRATHWPQCPSFPISCPNGCSSKNKVPREKLLTHLKEECDIKQRIRDMADTIELLELALQQKQNRIEELEAEVGSGEKLSLDKSFSKKSKNIFKRKGSKGFDDVGKETIEEMSDQVHPKSDQPHSNTEDQRGRGDSGKERNYEQEVKLLKECIAEKVTEIEGLRSRNLSQCNIVKQMEEDFSCQLKGMKEMCQKLSDEKEMLEKLISKQTTSPEDSFSQLI